MFPLVHCELSSLVVCEAMAFSYSVYTQNPKKLSKFRHSSHTLRVSVSDVTLVGLYGWEGRVGHQAGWGPEMLSRHWHRFIFFLKLNFLSIIKRLFNICTV